MVILVIAGVAMAGLMVVAVVGILAAIAIPNFLRFNLRSRAAEAKVNVRALATGELARFAEHDEFVAAGPSPAGTPGRDKRQFQPDAGFRELFFSPETPVYYQYEVKVSADGQRATVIARGDVDGDGEIAEYSQTLEGPTRGELIEPPPNVF